MRPFEEAIAAASAAEITPGAVLVAADKTGRFRYNKSFGKRSVRPGEDHSALNMDTVMCIASCSKVVTTIAVLQCCERGLLSLDATIYELLPEFKDLPVIRSFNADGSPVLEPHKAPITLRHLLNHTSGLAYDELHPMMEDWHKWHRTTPNRISTVEGRYSQPLVFEPGESWFYGPGIDWAGVALERACGGINLQRYFEENIFPKIGVRDIIFANYLYTRPDMQARIADMSKRDPRNPEKAIPSTAKPQNTERGGCIGGLGLFGSPADYFKVLESLITSDKERRLLGPEYLEEFFRPCLNEKSKEALNKRMELPENRRGMGHFPPTVSANWAVGGVINETDIPGGRRAGSMTWMGLPNIIWFLDRKSGLCGLYSGQIYPSGDEKIMELFSKFEYGIYEMYLKTSPRL
ncbi:beta-lactamase/transpeptidase-like protein [Xylaria nigripes]|nr:beta-lactamase/transpeptidase-like protein [Xylaria nigripes]